MGIRSSGSPEKREPQEDTNMTIIIDVKNQGFPSLIKDYSQIEIIDGLSYCIGIMAIP